MNAPHTLYLDLAPRYLHLFSHTSVAPPPPPLTLRLVVYMSCMRLSQLLLTCTPPPLLAGTSVGSEKAWSFRRVAKCCAWGSEWRGGRGGEGGRRSAGGCGLGEGLWSFRHAHRLVPPLIGRPPTTASLKAPHPFQLSFIQFEPHS